MNDALLQPADRIGSLLPYAPPARGGRITLTLDNNEGAPIDPMVLDTIREIDPESLTRYPDASGLERSIAQSFGVNSERVIVTNGGDDAIDRICRAVLNPGDTMLTHKPGFVMIPRYAQLAGAQVTLIDWLDGAFPEQRMLDAIDAGTKLIALISPSNPTGLIIDADSILTIATKAASNGTVLLLDQAYIEFADEDPIECLLDLPNVVIVRTFSKAMGLAGQRIGYAIGPQRIISWLRTVGGPYPVSVLSIALAQAVFAKKSQREPIFARTMLYRENLIKHLASLGIPALPSQANFVLARFKDAAGTHASLLERGVSVRRFRQGGDIDSYLRISVPANQSQQNQLINALSSIGATS
ncbi:MAG: pyridoxal phosphate-dependent aminotransferase [Phycisphaerales bacterium]